MGVPILAEHSIKNAQGSDKLESVTVWQVKNVNNRWRGISGTEKEFIADTLCMAVGLSPLAELLWQAGCKMLFVPQLGGHVPYRDENLRTTIENIFVAGDSSGVEEASAAMVEGHLAGVSVAEYLRVNFSNLEAKKQDCLIQLKSLRSGHMSERILTGIGQVLLS
jgi:sarcosine oxidase subunit alpha